MRLFQRLLILSLFVITLAPTALAAAKTVKTVTISEKVEVIKFNKDTDDLIVQRPNGERLLLQHNHVCSTMSVENPVELIINGAGKIIQVKVAFNEICDVYKTAPYSGEMKITQAITSDNALMPNHEAVAEWNNGEYRIDYGSGCPYMQNYIDTQVYLTLPGNTLVNGTLILPGYQGSCPIRSAELQKTLPPPAASMAQNITGLQYQAQTNQVYFYWNAPADATQKPLYLISYSTKAVNTDDYLFNQMPNLIYTHKNSYTVTNLGNNRLYYFYIAALDKDNHVGKWSTVSVTPVSAGGFKNNPDESLFVITFKSNTAKAYTLEWTALDHVKTYVVVYYVDGKPQFTKRLTGDIHEYSLPKKTSTAGKGYRFTVNTVRTSPYLTRLSDGIYWTDADLAGLSTVAGYKGAEYIKP